MTPFRPPLATARKLGWREFRFLGTHRYDTELGMTCVPWPILQYNRLLNNVIHVTRST
jgi:hypothetical protein